MLQGLLIYKQISKKRFRLIQISILLSYLDVLGILSFNQCGNIVLCCYCVRSRICRSNIRVRSPRVIKCGTNSHLLTPPLDLNRNKVRYNG